VKVEVEVEGRTLALSNLEKVLYPRDGFTKGDLIRYYARVAGVMLPHLRDRPVMLRRFPDGVEGTAFYEKRCPEYRPQWVRVSPAWVTSTGSRIATCLIHDTATLVWLANLAAIEIHPSLHHWQDRDRPTAMVLDLDPGPPAGLLEASRTALDLRALLDRLGLSVWPKTSGGKGLHLFVPLHVPVHYRETRNLARSLALFLATRQPGRVVAEIGSEKRRGKVLVDWGQNARQKSMAAPYSLRARDRPTVSMPVEWAEIEAAVDAGDPSALVFDAEAAAERVLRDGDRFAPVAERVQNLPRLGSPERLSR
jgi:bifunctional non-homologous end joining protein LigD